MSFIKKESYKMRALDSHMIQCLSIGFFLLLSTNASPTSTPSDPYFRGFVKTPVVATELTDRPYRTWMIPSLPHPDRLTYASNHGLLVYQCQSNPTDEESDLTFCFIDFREPVLTERMLPLPKQKTTRLFLGGPRAVSGDWVLGISGWKSDTYRAFHLKTGKQLIVGKIRKTPVDHPVGPFATIADHRVVWVDEYRDKTGRRNAIKLFDLNTHRAKTLFEVPPVHEVDQVALEKNLLVYSLVDLKDQESKGEVASDIYLYNLTTKTHTRLSQTKHASQPDIAWPYVVWKTGVFFGVSGIYLYNGETKTGTELIQATRGTSPIRSYEFPFISKEGVAWHGLDSDRRVVLYHPKTKTEEVLAKAGWTVSLAGHYLTWESDNEKDPSCTAPKKKDCLYFTDLSVPNRKQ